MNTREAKEILLLYRGPIDDSDPQFRAALDYAKSDPELGQWLREQTECYGTIRAKLRAIEPPLGLSDKIVHRRPIPFPRDWSRIVQLAAAVLISASITALLMKWSERRQSSVAGAQEILVTGEVLDMTCYIASQLERSRSRRVRESVHQKRIARWNQNSGWKGLSANRRTRPVDQRQAGGLRCQDCNNQRKANRARWLRATSSRRNSEILTNSPAG